MSAVVADELLLLIRAEVSDAVAGLKTVETQAEKSSGKMAASMKRAGQKMSAFVTLPLIGVGAAAVGAASDLDESFSKAEVVFGDAFAAIKEGSDNTADALSRAEYLDFAGTLGNILTGMEFTTAEASEMSLGFMTLAQDLASFNNVPVEQALTAIKGGLTGEREALKSLGIVIDDALVKQKAMEMGLWDGEGALSRNAMALASQELMYEKAGAAVGDFERTSDGLANSQKTTTSNIKDMLAILGARLIPIVQKVVGWVQKAVDWFTNLPEPIQTGVLIVGGLVAAIGPLLMALGMIIPAVTALIPVFAAISLPVLGVVAAIAAAVAIGVLLWKNWDKVMGFLKNLVKTVWGWIEDNIVRHLKNIWDWVVEVFDGIKAAISTALDWIADYIIAPLQRMWQTIVNVFETIVAVVTGYWNIIKGIFDWFMSVILSVIRLGAWIWQQTIGKAIEFIVNAVKAGLDWLVNLWKSALELAKSVISWGVDLWKNTIGKAITFVVDLIKAGLKLLVDLWRKGWETVLGIIKPIIGWVRDHIVTPIKDGIDKVIGFVAGLWDAFKRNFDKIKEKVTGVFGNIGKVMKDGFKAAVNWLIDKLNWAIDKINGLIRGANNLPGVNIKEIPNIPNLGFGGTLTQGGLVRVGDRGKPEVVNLPAGASVSPLGGGGGSGPLIGQLIVNGGDAMDTAREIGWQLTKRGR